VTRLWSNRIPMQMIGDMNTDTETDASASDPKQKKKPAKRIFNANRHSFIAKVKAAYEALQADGDPVPSEQAVRKKLGGGSLTDVNGALKIIRGELWVRFEPVVVQTRYTGEPITSHGAAAGSPIDDPSVGP
jgi:Plasmid replication region DNA-binding N-term